MPRRRGGNGGGRKRVRDVVLEVLESKGGEMKAMELVEEVIRRFDEMGESKSEKGIKLALRRMEREGLIVLEGSNWENFVVRKA